MASRRREAIWRRKKIARMPFERAMKQDLSKAWRVAAIAAGHELASGRDARAADEFRESLLRNLPAAWKRRMLPAGEHFGRKTATRIRRLMLAGKAQSEEHYQIKEAMRRWIVLQTSPVITPWIDNILAVIEPRLSNLAKAGLPPAEAARELLKAGGLTDHRAHRIARTEIVAAANMGSHVGAAVLIERSQRQWDKIWLSSRDSRVRPSHSLVDGQRKPTEGLFEVAGSLLLVPGDRTNGARGGAVVNCRCTVTYAPTGAFAP